MRQPLLESTLFAACHPLCRSQHTLSLSQQGHRQPFLHACLSVCVCKCYGNGQCEWQWECECEREWANKSIRRVAAPTGGSPCDLFHQCVSLAPTSAGQATGAAAAASRVDMRLNHDFCAYASCLSLSYCLALCTPLQT